MLYWNIWAWFRFGLPKEKWKSKDDMSWESNVNNKAEIGELDPNRPQSMKMTSDSFIHSFKRNEDLQDSFWGRTFMTSKESNYWKTSRETWFPRHGWRRWIPEVVASAVLFDSLVGIGCCLLACCRRLSAQELDRLPSQPSLINCNCLWMLPLAAVDGGIYGKISKLQSLSPLFHTTQ